MKLPVRSGMKAERDERRLIERAQGGDESAFAKLFESHKARVFSVILHSLNDVDDAEDATLEVFLKAWKAMDSYDHRSSFFAWLRAIAVRHTMNVLRHRSRRVQTVTASQLDPSDDFFDLLGEDRSLQPMDAVIQRERAVAIRDAVADLPVQFRAVICAFYLTDLTETEVASALGLPLGTVRRQKAEGLKKLRDTLLHYYKNEPQGGGRR